MEPTNTINYQENNFISSKLELRLAGGFPRWVAALIDSLILGIPIAVICLSLFVAATVLADNPNTESIGIIMIILTFCLYVILILAGMFFYEIYWPANHNGQTFGKKFMKIKIIDENGQNPQLSKHFLRLLMKIVFANIIGPFAYITILFHEKKQALYDMVANTYVVEE